jgi:hypothetical protein
VGIRDFREEHFLRDIAAVDPGLVHSTCRYDKPGRDHPGIRCKYLADLQGGASIESMMYSSLRDTPPRIDHGRAEISAQVNQAISSRSASQPVRRSGGQPVSRSGGQPVSRSAGQPASRSASQPVIPACRQSGSMHGRPSTGRFAWSVIVVLKYFCPGSMVCVLVHPVSGHARLVVPSIRLQEAHHDP